MSPVKDGPACPGCGLPNYEGMCSHCRGDQEGIRARASASSFTLEAEMVAGICEDAGHEWAPAGGGLLICMVCQEEKWA